MTVEIDHFFREVRINLWVTLKVCNRCGVVVHYEEQHYEWHASVDTVATTGIRKDGPKGERQHSSDD